MRSQANESGINDASNSNEESDGFGGYYLGTPMQKVLATWKIIKLDSLSNSFLNLKVDSDGYRIEMESREKLMENEVIQEIQEPDNDRIGTRLKKNPKTTFLNVFIGYF